MKIGIIGAGLSGLSAAKELLQTKPKKGDQKLSITVIEANDRVGGRTLSFCKEGINYDLGASWVGRTQTHIIKLAEDAKNQLIPQYQTGTKVMDIQNRISSYSSTIPTNVNILALLQMQWVVWKVDRMAAKLSVDDPMSYKYSKYWDSVTVKSWIDDNIFSERVKRMMEAAVRVILGAELNEISLLYLLWYVRQTHSFQNLVNISEGVQEKKLKLGTQQLSKYLEEFVKAQGVKIELSQKVSQIIQEDNVCIVMTENQKYIFDYLIIAMPPPNVNKIDFTPPLSVERKLVNEKTFMGSLGKLIIRYDKCYWRQKGFSGEILCDGYDSPISLTYDDTKTDQNGEVRAAMIVFVGGVSYRVWKGKQEKMREKILIKLAVYFQEPKMKEPLSIDFQKWDESATINGAPVACFPTGLLSQVKDLRRPEGRIHWAGTELAHQSCGFMDGAVDSGKRAAQEVSKVIGQKATQVPHSKNKEERKSYGDVYKKPWFQWW